MFEWGWGAQPDEWEEDGWFDADGNWHDVKELGGLREQPQSTAVDEEDIPF